MRRFSPIRLASGLFLVGAVLAWAAGLVAQPSQVGRWTGPFSWPLAASHAALLADGRVLAWNEVTGFSPRIWNPATGSFTTVTAIGTLVAGSGQAILADGDVAIVGGVNALGNGVTDAHRYDPGANTWTSIQYMSQARNLPTALLLGSGRLLALSGERAAMQPTDIHEVATVGSVWSSLTTAVLALPTTPWAFQLGDGDVLVAGPDPTTRRLSVEGNGSWLALGEMLAGTREAGTAVLLPAGTDRVLVIGGRDPATSSCELLDLATTTFWEYTNSMQRARRHHNATILADGSVLVTGGTLSGDDLAHAVYTAERYVPQTGQWTQLASMTVPRRRASVALLLPDARVLCAGGGDGSPGSEMHADAEIFEPPYLFLGTRPVITAAPATIIYGGGLTVTTPQAEEVSSVWMVRAGAVARGFNSDQRAVALQFTVGSGQLSVVAPADSNAAPPGTWMLFLVSDAGVPSVAKLVRLEVGVPPPIAPHITSTPPTTAIVAAPYSYLPVATGTTPMTWSLVSAPSWLRVSPSTGALFGVPTSIGTVSVSLRATNVVGNETQSWDLPVTTSLTGVKTLVPLGTTWRYFKGTVNPPANWASLGFDDSGWLSGPSGFGFSDNDDATVLSDMLNNYTTVFTRRTFEVYNVATVTKVSVLYEYDDGFAVYLNGTRIYSLRAPTTITNTSVATSSHEAGTALLRRDITDTAVRALLVEGVNVIAAVGLNADIGSSDATLKIVLELTGGTTTPVDVEPHEAGTAAFLGAGPNPFATETRLVFRLARPGPVRLDVYDVAGRLARNLAAPGPLAPGEHALLWDGRDASGIQVPPGVYLYRLQAPDLDRHGKLVRRR